ncbi:MAG: hypothetical protein SFX73_12120 [Kofleriaceae bacterium]|nr:hypothetical protein [Kofleriaceae bacterium]
MKRLAVLLVAAGCANGGGSSPTDASTGSDAPKIDAPTTDGPTNTDAMVDAQAVDAQVVDAAMIDAAMIDAPCVPVNTELLVNGSFDAAQRGMGWTEVNGPIVSSPNAVATQAGAYYAWLGGILAPEGGTVTDAVYQDITVPANTTQLRLTGYWTVRSGEDPSATAVYDSASLALTTTNNVPYTIVQQLSNLSENAAWQAIDHTFVQDLSGTTVRLRMTSTSDDSLETSFWFDTLSLVATHCP